MGRTFGFLMLVIVLAAGIYIYMRQTQSVMPAETNNPRATVDLVGVKSDLLAIAQAERSHIALHGNSASLAELQSGGELAMTRTSRGPYSYSVETSGADFRVVATYSGPESAMPKTISVDQSMELKQE